MFYVLFDLKSHMFNLMSHIESMTVYLVCELFSDIHVHLCKKRNVSEQLYNLLILIMRIHFLNTKTIPIESNIIISSISFL